MRCLPHAKVCYTQRNASKCIKNTSECCGRKRHSIREKTTLIPYSGHTRVYASSRGNIKGYQSSHKYSQIRGLDIRRYADIRGHSHRFTVTYPRMPLVTSALYGSLPMAVEPNKPVRRIGLLPVHVHIQPYRLWSLYPHSVCLWVPQHRYGEPSDAAVRQRLPLSTYSRAALLSA